MRPAGCGLPERVAAGHRRASVAATVAWGVVAAAVTCASAAAGMAADPAAAPVAVEAWCERVIAAPGDSTALDSLQECAAAPALHGTTAWQRARSLLQSHPHARRARLAPAVEPGERLRLHGVVRDAAGRPVPGALLHLFQTNAAGAYAPGRPMDEPHARLAAWIRSGPAGHYAVDTIRPGGYPGVVHLAGQERRIPAHIHYEVKGGPAGEARFQLVFADDPRLDAHWRRWAQDGGHPIVALSRDSAGVWSGTCDITLHP